MRNIPDWRPELTETPVFDVVTRPIGGPLVHVACDATNTGEVEIPFELGLREIAVDATASFTEPKSLRLADISVLSLHDRTVKLRFTMAGVPLPPFSTTCTPSQALVSVRVNIHSDGAATTLTVVARVSRIGARGRGALTDRAPL